MLRWRNSMGLTLSSANSQSWGIDTFDKILEGKRKTTNHFSLYLSCHSPSVSFINTSWSWWQRGNSNGVIPVQAYKNGVREPFRIWSLAVSPSVRTWILLNYTRPKDTICQLQHYGLRVSFCNCVTISDPNQSLLKKHPDFLAVPITILDKELI